MWLTDGQSERSLRYISVRDPEPKRWHALKHGFIEIGVALTSFGAFFMLMGVLLFFDGGLLALGNVCALPWFFLAWISDSTLYPYFALQILFISGLTLIIGPTKTFYFFARKNKLRGSVCFLGGVLLVFLKWPFVGMIVETFGFLNLFGWVLICNLGGVFLLCGCFEIS